MTGGAGTAISVWLSGEAACNNNAQDQIILTNRNNPLGIQLALICHFTPRVGGGRVGEVLVDKLQTARVNMWREFYRISDLLKYLLMLGQVITCGNTVELSDCPGCLPQNKK